MRILDISLPLGARTPIWPGDPVFLLHPMRDSTGVQVSRLIMGTHTGTHVDAPRHLTVGGMSVDQLPLESLVGLAQVLDVSHCAEIGAAQLAAMLGSQFHRRVILKAGSSEEPNPLYLPLDLSAARWLVDHRVCLLATDCFSVEIPLGGGELPVHQTLLGAGSVVVEGLRLTDVLPGAYLLAVLPLAIEEADGAPARAILVEL